ncbi:MAG: LCP family protein [Spirochaetia bacterium]
MSSEKKKPLHPLIRYLVLIAGIGILIAWSVSFFYLNLHLQKLAARLEVLEEESREEADDSSVEDENEIFEKTVEGVDTLLHNRNSEKTAQIFETLADPDGGEQSLTARTGLRYRSDSKLRGSLFRNDRRYFRIIGYEVRGEVELQSRSGARKVVSEADHEALAFVLKEREKLDEVFGTQELMKKQLTELFNTGEAAQLVDEKELSTTRIVRDGFVLRRGIINSGGAVVARLAADAENEEYSVEGKRTGDLDRFEQIIVEKIEAYDPRSELRLAYEKLHDKYKEFIENEGFKDYLKARELSIAEKPVQEKGSDFIRRFPIKVSDGKDIGFFRIDAKEGVIALETPARETKVVVERIAVQHGLLGQPEENTDDPTFLLIGKHDGLTDTIILVKPNPKTISMLSIPRDLYYEEHKINELLMKFGPEEFISVIERITQVNIDHYFTIDIDGFQQLVDALGTITVELEEELLDPNMHYSLNGESTMLFFSPGKHEINGSAALALARSRSTTSDFSRARRQQLILDGIRDRIDRLNLTDADKLYDIVEAILRYTETDLNVNDIIRFYRRYRDARELRSKVLSNDNVLYSTYAGLQERDMKLEQAEELDENQLGAWILLPRQDDWNLIPWYVHTWLSGVEPTLEEKLESGEIEEEHGEEL